MTQVLRAVVVLSTIVAAFLEAHFATMYSPPMVWWIATAGFVLLLAAGSQLRAIAMPIVLASIYLTPAIFIATQGGSNYGLDVIWILPLLGLMLSDRGALQWSLPARWQWPLVTWSAMVAIAWPIVFLREADFALWILPLQRVSNTSIGIGPAEVGQNIAYFALLHNFGILFVDALCRWYRLERERFGREVLAPLIITATVSAALAIYQGFVDLTFLNQGFWAYMIRASGTLADPNKLGAITAFWTIGAIVFARRLPGRWMMIVTALALVLGVATVWLSGSRTGLASLFVGVALAAVETLRWSRLDLKKLAAAAGATLAAGAVLVVILQSASTHTIVQRGTLGYLPFFGDRGIAESANELLWVRFGYGPTAIAMVKEHPIEGVGPGMFHALSHDFGQVAGYTIPMPDNAQNWLRHNIAELGLLGSIPMLWWCLVLLRQLFSPGPSADRLSFGMLRGVLIAFFIASLFGMPAQAMAIVITFWVFAFWLQVEGGDSTQEKTSWGRVAQVTAIALIVAHAGMTTVDAFGSLRPRERSQRFNWYYRYGYVQPDDVEPDPGGNAIGRRWTMKKSLAVIPVKGKVLKFVAWIDHPDSDQRPVHARVWADSTLVYEGDLRRSPLFLDIPAAPGKKHLILETEIDRTWRPSDSGGRDRRELGLSVRDWVWE
jgi:O-antigen ligase